MATVLMMKALKSGSEAALEDALSDSSDDESEEFQMQIDDEVALDLTRPNSKSDTASNRPVSGGNTGRGEEDKKEAMSNAQIRSLVRRSSAQKSIAQSLKKSKMFVLWNVPFDKSRM